MNKDMVKAYIKAIQKIIIDVEEEKEKENEIRLENIRQIFNLAYYSGMSKDDEEEYFGMAENVINEFNRNGYEHNEWLSDFFNETNSYIYNVLEK